MKETVLWVVGWIVLGTLIPTTYAQADRSHRYKTINTQHPVWHRPKHPFFNRQPPIPKPEYQLLTNNFSSFYPSPQIPSRLTNFISKVPSDNGPIIFQRHVSNFTGDDTDYNTAERHLNNFIYSRIPLKILDKFSNHNYRQFHQALKARLKPNTASWDQSYDCRKLVPDLNSNVIRHSERDSEKHREANDIFQKEGIINVHKDNTKGSLISNMHNLKSRFKPGYDRVQVNDENTNYTEKEAEPMESRAMFYVPHQPKANISLTAQGPESFLNKFNQEIMKAAKKAFEEEKLKRKLSKSEQVSLDGVNVESGEFESTTTSKELALLKSIIIEKEEDEVPESTSNSRKLSKTNPVEILHEESVESESTTTSRKLAKSNSPDSKNVECEAESTTSTSKVVSASTIRMKQEESDELKTTNTSAKMTTMKAEESESKLTMSNSFDIMKAECRESESSTTSRKLVKPELLNSMNVESGNVSLTSSSNQTSNEPSIQQMDVSTEVPIQLDAKVKNNDTILLLTKISLASESKPHVDVAKVDSDKTNTTSANLTSKGKKKKGTKKENKEKIDKAVHNKSDAVRKDAISNDNKLEGQRYQPESCALSGNQANAEGNKEEPSRELFKLNPALKTIVKYSINPSEAQSVTEIFSATEEQALDGGSNVGDIKTFSRSDKKEWISPDSITRDSKVVSRPVFKKLSTLLGLGGREDDKTKPFSETYRAELSVPKIQNKPIIDSIKFTIHKQAESSEEPNLKVGPVEENTTEISDVPVVLQSITESSNEQNEDGPGTIQMSLILNPPNYKKGIKNILRNEGEENSYLATDQATDDSNKFIQSANGERPVLQIKSTKNFTVTPFFKVEVNHDRNQNSRKWKEISKRGGRNINGATKFVTAKIISKQGNRMPGNLSNANKIMMENIKTPNAKKLSDGEVQILVGPNDGKLNYAYPESIPSIDDIIILPNILPTKTFGNSNLSINLQGNKNEAATILKNANNEYILVPNKSHGHKTSIRNDTETRVISDEYIDFIPLKGLTESTPPTELQLKDDWRDSKKLLKIIKQMSEILYRAHKKIELMQRLRKRLKQTKQDRNVCRQADGKNYVSSNGLISTSRRKTTDSIESKTENEIMEDLTSILENLFTEWTKVINKAYQPQNIGMKETWQFLNISNLEKDDLKKDADKYEGLAKKLHSDFQKNFEINRAREGKPVQIKPKNSDAPGQVSPPCALGARPRGRTSNRTAITHSGGAVSQANWCPSSKVLQVS